MQFVVADGIRTSSSAQHGSGAALCPGVTPIFWTLPETTTANLTLPRARGTRAAVGRLGNVLLALQGRMRTEGNIFLSSNGLIGVQDQNFIILNPSNSSAGVPVGSSIENHSIPLSAVGSSPNASGGTTTLPPIVHKFKTQLCRHYVHAGFCAYEENCIYAHGEDELRRQSDNLGLTVPQNPNIPRPSQDVIAGRNPKIPFKVDPQARLLPSTIAPTVEGTAITEARAGKEGRAQQQAELIEQICNRISALEQTHANLERVLLAVITKIQVLLEASSVAPPATSLQTCVASNLATSNSQKHTTPASDSSHQKMRAIEMGWEEDALSLYSSSTAVSRPECDTEVSNVDAEPSEH